MKKFILSTIENKDVPIYFPENLNEISIDKFIEMQKPDLTDAQIISAMTRVNVETIYDASNLSELTYMGKLYLDAFLSTVSANYPMPRYIKVLGKRIFVGNKPVIDPIGVWMAACNIVDADIETAKLIYGEDWVNNFNPPLESYKEFVNEVLHGLLICKRRKGSYKRNGVDYCGQLTASNVLAIAKYFYSNIYNPKENRPSHWMGSLSKWDIVYWQNRYSDYKARKEQKRLKKLANVN